MPPETYLSVKKRWNFIRSTPAISYYDLSNQDDYRYTERITMPIADRHGVAKYIFGCSYYERFRSMDASDPPMISDNITIFKL